MTVSKPYATVVADSFPGELGVLGGQISLDVARWPYVNAVVSVKAVPGLYAALDPRTEPRRVTLTCGDEIAGSERTFDLGVRSVVATADNRLQLTLASDEALVEDNGWPEDYRPWDALNYEYGYTAGGVARMVLARVGATVADPTPNPSLFPYWELKNRITNPRFQTTTKGSAVSSGSSNLLSASHVAAGDVSRRALQWTCAPAGGVVVVAGYDPDDGALTALPVTPGEWLSVSVDVSAVAPNRARAVRMTFHMAGGSLYEITSPLESAPDTRWTTLTLVEKAPPATEYVSIRVEGGPISSGADQRMFATNVCLVNWEDTIVPFHGDTPPTPGYTYAWDGVPDDSTSTRYPLTPRDPESLVQRAGVGGITFLAPLLQSVGLRLVCDENRVWTLRHIDHAVPGSVRIAVGENMIDYTIGAELDGWADAATVLYKWRRYGIDLEQEDTFQLTGAPRKHLYRELNTPYPGPGRAENIVKRAQSGGTSATATALTKWSATPEQAVTIETSIDGHIDTTYTPWVEQRRNLFDDPAPASIAAPASGMTRWFRNSGSSALVALDPDGWVRIYADIALTDATAARAANWAGNGKTVSAETTYTLSFDQEKAAGLGDLRLAWWAYTAAGVGIGGERIALPQVADSGRVYYTFTTPTNAERIAFVVRRNPQSAWVAGDWYRIRRTRLALGMDATYFDGATEPGGELERTRWLGTPNASASVLETRQVESSTWVNDPEVVLVGTVGAVTFDLDTDQMTVAIRPDEETP